MNDTISWNGVQIGETADGATCFGIKVGDLTIIIDHYPDGDMVLLVDKEGGFKEIWEYGVRNGYTVVPPPNQIPAE